MNVGLINAEINDLFFLVVATIIMKFNHEDGDRVMHTFK